MPWHPLAGVDKNHNGKIDIAELFDVIDAYFSEETITHPGSPPIPTPTNTPAPTPTNTPAPTPTNTPTPTPPASQDNGDWVYSGPDCPGAYPNCSPTPRENPVIDLTSFSSTKISDKEFQTKPFLLVTCSTSGNPVFAFHGGGPLISLGQPVMHILYTDQTLSEGTEYHTGRSASNSESVYFILEDARAILQFIEQAELQDKDISIAAVSYVDGTRADAVVASFDVTGYLVNFQRLPCSNDQ